MVNYYTEVQKEAVDFVDQYFDEFVEAIINEEDNPTYDSLESEFHCDITDRGYTLTDAAFVIENSNNVEEDSGIWEGLSPTDAIQSQAAYTFGNDVHEEIGEIYDDLKDEYETFYNACIDELNDEHEKDVDGKDDPDDDRYDENFVDDDFDPEEEARDMAKQQLTLYFKNNYTDAAIVPLTSNADKINAIRRYLKMGEQSCRSGYPVGGAYIDSRCGVGYGESNEYDYVEYDHEIAKLIPEIRGMGKDKVKEYLKSIES